MVRGAGGGGGGEAGWLAGWLRYLRMLTLGGKDIRGRSRIFLKRGWVAWRSGIFFQRGGATTYSGQFVLEINKIFSKRGPDHLNPPPPPPPCICPWILDKTGGGGGGGGFTQNLSKHKLRLNVTRLITLYTLQYIYNKSRGFTKNNASIALELTPVSM